MNAKSIFDALNEIRDKKADENYNYKMSDSGNTEKVEEPGNKASKDKLDKLKKNRKDSYKENMVDLEDESDEEKKTKVNTGDKTIELSDDEILKLKDILTALKVPESVENSFEEENYDEVYEFLKDEYGIRYDQKIVKKKEEVEESTEEKEEVEESTEEEESEEQNEEFLEENKLYIEDNVKLAVMEDGFATANTNKWDINLMVYEGGEDSVVFEALDIDDDIVKLNMKFDEENIDKEVYMEVEEMKKILK